MNQNKDQKINCGPPNIGSGCCKVESVVTVDSKGQILLPKDLREKANINAGDKLVVINLQSQGEPCCLTLIKADRLGDMVKNFLGPVMKDIVSKF